MAINSKADLCNITLSRLGNYGSVNDIDSPVSQKELTFALWYDVARQSYLKISMPNFSLKRRIVGSVAETPAFGFSYVYEYPQDCLKLLGIGDIEDKRNDYCVEGNRIYTDTYYENGLPIRFIADITDVTAMSPEWKIGFSWYLAGEVVMDITQDAAKAKVMQAMIGSKLAEISGLNAQENMPIRISRSKFRASRYQAFPTNVSKK